MLGGFYNSKLQQWLEEANIIKQFNIKDMIERKKKSGKQNSRW